LIVNYFIKLNKGLFIVRVSKQMNKTNHLIICILNN
jgi:hypothetical protein